MISGEISQDRLYLKLKSSLYLGNRIFGELLVICIAVLKNIYASEHFFNQSVKLLPQFSGLRIWSPSKKFGHGMYLNDLLYLLLSIK